MKHGGVVVLGRIKPRFVKNIARYLVANYFNLLKSVWDKSMELQQLTGDKKLAGEYRFNAYKRIVDNLTNIKSKRIRNKVAGAIVRLMKQILILERISLEELRAKYHLRPREEIVPEHLEETETVME